MAGKGKSGHLDWCSHDLVPDERKKINGWMAISAHLMLFLRFNSRLIDFNSNFRGNYISIKVLCLKKNKKAKKTEKFSRLKCFPCD